MRFPAYKDIDEVMGVGGLDVGFAEREIDHGGRRVPRCHASTLLGSGC